MLVRYSDYRVKYVYMLVEERDGRQSEEGGRGGCLLQVIGWLCRYDGTCA